MMYFYFSLENPPIFIIYPYKLIMLTVINLLLIGLVVVKVSILHIKENARTNEKPG